MKLEKPPEIEYNFPNYAKWLNDPSLLTFINETDKRYFYWNELKYRPNLPTNNAEEIWGVIKLHRFVKSQILYFGAHKFGYNLTSYIQKDLHEFDLKLIGGLYQDAITPQEQDEYFKNSLIEEAIASSQIEGAATTTNIAREMIKSGRKPRTESEQMIFNNFAAIKAIEKRLEEKLNEEIILDIHEIMTSRTDANQYAGRFRSGPIYVKDHLDGEIAHTAPEHEEIPVLIQSLIDFINNEDEFIHPIIKASILHFMMGYIHPFGDGNGRTARALFYWYLMKKGYNMIRHISISRAILDSRTSYDKAFLKTEYDQNDLTYFIMYSIKSLRVAFQSLVKYRDGKREERLQASKIVYELSHSNINKRQADLLGYLYLHPNAQITIPQYSKRHDIVRQTGNKDLTQLVDLGVLKTYKNGKYIIFQLIDQAKVISLTNPPHP